MLFEPQSKAKIFFIEVSANVDIGSVVISSSKHALTQSYHQVGDGKHLLHNEDDESHIVSREHKTANENKQNYRKTVTMKNLTLK